MLSYIVKPSLGTEPPDLHMIIRVREGGLADIPPTTPAKALIMARAKETGTLGTSGIAKLHDSTTGTFKTFGRCSLSFFDV